MLSRTNSTRLTIRSGALISFRSNLTSSFYIGYDYQFHVNHSAGIVVYSDFIKNSISPVVGLNYHLNFSVFNLIANVSYRNSRFDNFGFGLSANLGPIQIYGLTENVAGVFSPENSRRIDARLGINIAIKEKKPFE